MTETAPFTLWTALFAAGILLFLCAVLAVLTPSAELVPMREVPRRFGFNVILFGGFATLYGGMEWVWAH